MDAQMHAMGMFAEGRFDRVAPRYPACAPAYRPSPAMG